MSCRYTGKNSGFIANHFQFLRHVYAFQSNQILADDRIFAQIITEEIMQVFLETGSALGQMIVDTRALAPSPTSPSVPATKNKGICDSALPARRGANRFRTLCLQSPYILLARP